MTVRLSWPAVTALILLAPACDQPASINLDPPADLPTRLAALHCSADIRAQTLSCDDASVSGEANLSMLVVGGQHHLVRLASSAISYDAATDVLSARVTVQNLLLVAMGTADGGTPHADGVRVFFETDPTNGVTVANPTGAGTFTRASQAYFEYSGAVLGRDSILKPDEVSAAKVWQFEMNGAPNVSFTVYVQAEVPAGDLHSAHFTHISTGDNWTCALDSGGRAYCWGLEILGPGLFGDLAAVRLGVPTPAQMPAGVTFTSISAGDYHVCALATNAKAYCWGRDLEGQVGNGGTADTDLAAPSEVVLPPGVTFSTISAGDLHTCALGSDQRAYCWGSDEYGRLGNGAALTANQLTPSQVALPAGVTLTSISTGEVHTCAISSAAKGYCWGSDAEGNLGNGALTGNRTSPSEVAVPTGVTLTSISVGNSHTCALSSGGIAYCWGSDNGGGLGNGPTTGNQISPSEVAIPAGVAFTAITAGGSHTCALSADDRTFCWGADGFGQLGNGEPIGTATHSPSEVAAPTAVTFTHISAGYGRTCAVSLGPAFCWGWNHERQIGDGTEINRAVPVVVAGSR